MPGIDYKKLKEMASMADVLPVIGWEARHVEGDQRRGVCPLCNAGQTSGRRFAVRGNAWHCFGCKEGKGKSHLDLFRLATRLEIYPAALELCRRLKITVPWLTQGQPRH